VTPCSPGPRSTFFLTSAFLMVTPFSCQITGKMLGPASFSALCSYLGNTLPLPLPPHTILWGGGVKTSVE
jgi:hypothetical protein